MCASACNTCSVVSIRCTAWLSLESVGIAAHGCLRSPGWIHQVVFPVYQPHAFSPYYIREPSSRLIYLRTAYKGTYGHIEIARYETSEGSKEVYVKRPIHQGSSLIHEACVEIVVREFLESIGIQQGVPRVVRIFCLRDGSICFAMEAIEGLSKDLTLLIIAHRLTTLKNCTHIVKLSEGKISQTGSYEDIVGNFSRNMNS